MNSLDSLPSLHGALETLQTLQTTLLKKGGEVSCIKNSLDIFFKCGANFEQITGINQSILEKILRYFLHGPVQEPFDCNSFIHFIHGFGYKYGGIELGMDWDFETFLNEGELQVGESILMIFNDNISHVALYLGKGKYLSKIGRGGPVAVTSLKEMEAVYPSDSILIIRPNYNY